MRPRLATAQVFHRIGCKSLSISERTPWFSKSLWRNEIIGVIVARRDSITVDRWSNPNLLESSQASSRIHAADGGVMTIRKQYLSRCDMETTTALRFFGLVVKTQN